MTAFYGEYGHASGYGSGTATNTLTAANTTIGNGNFVTLGGGAGFLTSDSVDYWGLGMTQKIDAAAMDAVPRLAPLQPERDAFGCGQRPALGHRHGHRWCAHPVLSWSPDEIGRAALCGPSAFLDAVTACAEIVTWHANNTFPLNRSHPLNQHVETCVAVYISRWSRWRRAYACPDRGEGAELCG